MFDEKGYKAAFSKVTASEELRQQILNLNRGKRIGISKAVAAGVAAVLVFFLLACAVVLDVRPMMEALFGTNGRERIAAEEYVLQYENGRNQMVSTGGGNRTELNIELADEYIIPHIFEINKTIHDEDTTLTAQYGIIDRATCTGAFYMKIENPPAYRATNRGQILWENENDEYFPYLNYTPIGQLGFVGNEMIVEALTTDDVLYMTYLFTCEKSCTGMLLSINGNEETIDISFPMETEMRYLSLADGKIILSPFGAKLNSKFFGMNFMTLDVVSIRYRNGEEYILQWEDPVFRDPETGLPNYGENSFFDVETQKQYINGIEVQPSYYNVNYTAFMDDENTELVYFFNRVLDLNEVNSVVINGEEFFVE